MTKGISDPAGYTRLTRGGVDLWVPVRIAMELTATDPGRRSHRVVDEQELPAEVEDLNIDDRLRPAEGDLVMDSAPDHWTVQMHTVRALATQVRSIADAEHRAVLKAICKDLAERGPMRQIAWPEDLNSVEILRQECPNYGAVVQVVLDELVAAKRAGRPPSIPPLLLVGPPGVGKTHFATRLAEVLGVPCRRMSFDSAVASSSLAGLDRHWSTGKAGEVFDAVGRGEYANPVFVLDEIDKAVRSRSDDALAPLHSLLEPATATRFRDVYVPVEIDVSHITWLATANHAEAIPATLRSRFAEFEIGEPTAEQAILLAHHVVARVACKAAPQGFEAISPRLIVDIAHLTPREIRKAIRAAISRAVAAGRNSVQERDLPAELIGQREAAPTIH